MSLDPNIDLERVGQSPAASAYTLAAQLTKRVETLERRLLNFERRRLFAFANGWRAYGGGAAPWGHQGYAKLPGGLVVLEGLLDKAGGNWVANEVILTLPAGYRPPSNRVFAPPVSPAAANGSQRIDITPDGNVVLIVGGATNPVGWLSLDGITFRAA